MVQLQLVSAGPAGETWVARRLPVRIGRSSRADLRLEAPGVWDHHLELSFRPPDGFVLTVQAQARATVNGQPVTETTLRNGDLIELGGVALRFWLSPPRPTGLVIREAVVWGLVLAVTVGQLALIYWALD